MMSSATPFCKGFLSFFQNVMMRRIRRPNHVALLGEIKGAKQYTDMAPTYAEWMMGGGGGGWL